jgi:hypothetical protein
MGDGSGGCAEGEKQGSGRRAGIAQHDAYAKHAGKKRRRDDWLARPLFCLYCPISPFSSNIMHPARDAGCAGDACTVLRGGGCTRTAPQPRAWSTQLSLSSLSACHGLHSGERRRAMTRVARDPWMDDMVGGWDRDRLLLFSTYHFPLGHFTSRVVSCWAATF